MLWVSNLTIQRNQEQGNPFRQLWAVFNVSLILVGNDLSRVGTYIYLDPTVAGLGNPFTEGSISNLMGLGGYYFVTKVSHSYYPTWETQIEAVSAVPSYLQSDYNTESPFVYIIREKAMSTKLYK